MMRREDDASNERREVNEARREDGEEEERQMNREREREAEAGGKVEGVNRDGEEKRQI